MDVIGLSDVNICESTDWKGLGSTVKGVTVSDG